MFQRVDLLGGDPHLPSAWSIQSTHVRVAPEVGSFGLQHVCKMALSTCWPTARAETDSDYSSSVACGTVVLASPCAGESQAFTSVVANTLNYTQ